MPEASKLSSELIAQDTSDDTYDEEFMTDVEVDLRNEQRKKSYIDNAYKKKIEAGRSNAEAFAKQQGLDLEIMTNWLPSILVLIKFDTSFKILGSSIRWKSSSTIFVL